MTAQQSIRGRRKAKLDPRYAHKGNKDATSSAKKLQRKIEEEKLRQGRRGKK